MYSPTTGLDVIATGSSTRRFIVAPQRRGSTLPRPGGPPDPFIHFSLSLSQSTAEPCICGQEKMHPWHKKTHEQHDSLWESLAVTSPSVLLVKVVE